VPRDRSARGARPTRYPDLHLPDQFRREGIEELGWSLELPVRALRSNSKSDTFQKEVPRGGLLRPLWQIRNPTSARASGVIGCPRRRLTDRSGCLRTVSDSEMLSWSIRSERCDGYPGAMSDVTVPVVAVKNSRASLQLMKGS
jgi:hypothetical protein